MLVPAAGGSHCLARVHAWAARTCVHAAWPAAAQRAQTRKGHKSSVWLRPCASHRPAGSHSANMAHVHCSCAVVVRQTTQSFDPTRRHRPRRACMLNYMHTRSRSTAAQCIGRGCGQVSKQPLTRTQTSVPHASRVRARMRAAAARALHDGKYAFANTESHARRAGRAGRRAQRAPGRRWQG